MSYSKATDEMEVIIKAIMEDLPKVYNGNKLATQRVRCATIKLAKHSKDWRRLSLQDEKKRRK